MNHELVETIFHDRDPVTNTVKVTKTIDPEIAKAIDPEIAKAMFLEAVKNIQEDYR